MPNFGPSGMRALCIINAVATFNTVMSPKKKWVLDQARTVGVKFFGGAKMEQSVCAMGKRAPPLAYAIYYKKYVV